MIFPGHYIPLALPLWQIVKALCRSRCNDYRSGRHQMLIGLFLSFPRFGMGNKERKCLLMVLWDGSWPGECFGCVCVRFVNVVFGFRVVISKRWRFILLVSSFIVISEWTLDITNIIEMPLPIAMATIYFHVIFTKINVTVFFKTFYSRYKRWQRFELLVIISVHAHCLRG